MYLWADAEDLGLVWRLAVGHIDEKRLISNLRDDCNELLVSNYCNPVGCI